MTQAAAIAKALLKGEVISIMTAFKQFGCTNAPREISRSIEKKFGVQVSKTPVKFKSKYGKEGVYYQYRLNHTEYNAEGIKKMIEYVKAQVPVIENPKTQKEAKSAQQMKQINLL